MRGPRIWRRVRAFVTGYFWLPCPNCGQMFAGYEKGGGTLMHSIGEGRMCCPSCPQEKLPNEGILYPSYYIAVHPDGRHEYVYGEPPVVSNQENSHD